MKFHTRFVIAGLVVIVFSCKDNRTTEPVENKNDIGSAEIISIYLKYVDSLRMQPSTFYLDGDFVRFLRIQLEAGNKLAEMEINHGKNESLKEVANRIKEANNDHIIILEEYMSVPIAVPGDSNFFKEMQQKLLAIDTVFSETDVDDAFVVVMQQNLALTISMTKSYNRQASSYERKNENLMNLASKIEAEKESETKMLKQSN